MSILSRDIYWLNSYETNNKEHNIEIGFDTHTLLMGYTQKNTYTDVDELPNSEFFLEISKIIPKRYADENVTYGEMICYVENRKYRVIYHYDTNCYMITDDEDLVIKKIEGNK